MIGRMLLTLAVGWLLGALTILAGVALTGGFYEYRLVVGGDNVPEMINRQCWQVERWIPASQHAGGMIYLRRPRLRLAC